MSNTDLTAADRALVYLGRSLRAARYRFITVTPLTHQRVLARDPGVWATDLRGVFGWNQRFREGLLSAERLTWMHDAGILQPDSAGGWRSKVRFSSLGEALCVHGGFPTSERDAVFFGPDTYRFAAFVQQHAAAAPRAVDIGCGSGAGMLALASRVQEGICADLSANALRLSAVNAAINHDLHHASLSHRESDLFRSLDGNFDLIVANPPYLLDDAARLYRHGGDHLGIDLAVRIVQEGLPRLNPAGQLLLYTGSPIVDGRSLVHQAVADVLRVHGDAMTLRVIELDPDVFGEELERPCYRTVERIAAVGMNITRHAS